MIRFVGLILISALICSLNSCTDLQGDGIHTVIWEGSVVPQDSCYRNPVWEPDLSKPSVFSAAVGYFAFGVDKEWSPGLHYTAPVLSSNDLMNWRLRGEAFQERPDWAEGYITGISAAFAKTRGTYYLFYTLGDQGIGMAASKAPQGPYSDFGLLINSDSVGMAECSHPFFFPYGSKAYLFFQGGDGMYGLELLLSKTELATVNGAPFKVAGNHISSLSMIRMDGSYYLFGVEEDGDQSRVTVARSEDVSGPYLDQDGSSLLNGGGTLVLRGNAEHGFVEVKHVGGVFEDGNGEVWITYQATDIDKPLLSSGEDRHPMLLSHLNFDTSGWPVGITESTGGWNFPKFAK